MDHLVLARHGEWDTRGHFTDTGFGEVERLRQALESLLAGKRIVMLSSTRPPAIATAKALLPLCGEFEQHTILRPFSNDLELDQAQKILRLINSRQDVAEALVLVTHGPQTDCLPYYFGRDVLATNFPKWLAVPKGGAAYINCPAKTLTLLPMK